jgi:hypothetical protein
MHVDRCHPTEALVKAQADAMKLHLAHVGYVSTMPTCVYTSL